MNRRAQNTVQSSNDHRNLRVSVPPGKGGVRLDRFLSDAIGDMSRNRLQSLVRNGDVLVNGVVVPESKHMVCVSDIIDVRIPPTVPAVPVAQDIPLNVVYEDDDLIVVDKPAGLVVHPAAGNPDNTLVNALLSHCGDSLSGIGGVVRPGIVHRLDKGTSGLIVVAKNAQSHASLSAQFADHSIERTYRALVWGIPSPGQGTITGNIGRNPKNRKTMTVVSRGGKHAVTHYSVGRVFGTFAALVDCRLETGRTHQIRVHMASKGHPLIGDPGYGGGVKRARHLGGRIVDAVRNHNHQALHAVTLGFLHPSRNIRMVWQSELPDDFTCLLDQIEI